MAIALPEPPESNNIRSLSYWKSERLSGIAGDVLTFENVIDPVGHLLFKNGALVDPDTYTVTAEAIEGVAPSSELEDVWVLHYHFREN